MFLEIMMKIPYVCYVTPDPYQSMFLHIDRMNNMCFPHTLCFRRLENVMSKYESPIQPLQESIFMEIRIKVMFVYPMLSCTPAAIVKHLNGFQKGYTSKNGISRTRTTLAWLRHISVLISALKAGYMIFATFVKKRRARSTNVHHE